MSFYTSLLVCFLVFYGCYQLGLALSKAKLPESKENYIFNQAEIKDAVFDEIEESYLKDNNNLSLPAPTSYKKIL